MLRSNGQGHKDEPYRDLHLALVELRLEVNSCIAGAGKLCT